MNMIKDIFAYTGIGVKREYWIFYDDMNQKILEIMEKSRVKG